MARVLAAARALGLVPVLVLELEPVRLVDAALDPAGAGAAVDDAGCHRSTSLTRRA